MAGEPDIDPPFLCTLFDGLLVQRVRPAANTEGGVCKRAWRARRVRSLRSLYIYVCPSNPYQEISPPVAFSSPRAGAWCVGRGRRSAGAAVGEGRRTSVCASSRYRLSPEAGLKGVIFLKLFPPVRCWVSPRRMTTVYSYCSGRPYMCIRCICRGPPYIWMTTVIVQKAPTVHVQFPS